VLQTKIGENVQMRFRGWVAFTLIVVHLVQFPLSAEFAPRQELRGDSSFAPSVDPRRPRNTFFPTLLTLALPGLDQMLENQFGSASAYAVVGGIGLGVATAADLKNPWWRSPIDIYGRNDTNRTQMLGLQMYFMAGALSAYHSFRTAVRTNQPSGLYVFISQEESIGTLLSSPLHFKYLTRPTTFMPLLLGTAALALAALAHGADGDRAEPVQYGAADGTFSAALGYGAGVSEEAVFHGWLMPVVMQVSGSPFLSNAITAGLSAAIHVPTRKGFPWQQLALSLYLGWLTQKRDWTIGESIFVHTWWDILAFSSVYAFGDKGLRPAFYLPLVNMRL